MRILAIIPLLAAVPFALAQTYREGALTLPGPLANPIYLKLQVWQAGQITTARIGGETVLFALDSASNPGFEIVDLQTKQAVTVVASNDPTSIKSLFQWEGSLFPLLPTHAGFASDWDDFASTVKSMEAAGIFSNVHPEGVESGSGSISYDSALPEIGGKVTWGFETIGGEREMVSWAYMPINGKGMRSERIGKGDVQTQKQALSYGSGPEGMAPEASDFKKFAQSQVQIVGGSLTKPSGFLNTAQETSAWLLDRTAYRLH